MKQRLDQLIVQRKLAQSRSQAENLIRLGRVKVDGKPVAKAGTFVDDKANISVKAERYVSRAGLKLASVAQKLSLDFRESVVLDVGSSTGGFTDYALQHGARKVIAVDVGTDQLHPSLLGDKRIELHEKTDIREFETDETVTIVVIDVSFISLREILPSVAKLAPKAAIAAMVKPQFEAGREQVSKGVIKNDNIRRQILKDFEAWTKQYFVILDKADSDVSGTKGNRERFYQLKPLA
ncbi:MAG TPA: TlyA family RNA methyltransferase [Candidatus Saccharibacteria bacterium]|nr:TlyA family RNA methyltransferase [Candidatus Saccharibacteria bacterium]HRK94125.1 TlyA family RNA methyltransferase [Candidatus Saccharibacteria bacterium]